MPNVLTNSDFSVWSGSTSFTNPANNTETADGWFTTGLATNGCEVDQSANILIKAGSNPIVGGIYQIVPSGSTYANRVIDIFVHAISGSVTPPNLRIVIDDGIVQHTSGDFGIAGGGGTSVNYSTTLDSSATQLVVYFISASSSGTQLLLDSSSVIPHLYHNSSETITLVSADTSVGSFFRDFNEVLSLIDNIGSVFNNGIKISVSDAILLVDVLFVVPLRQALVDSVRLQDWLRIRRISVKRWFN